LTGIASNAGTSLRYLAASDQDAARQYLELIVRDVRRAAEIVGKVRGLARGAPLKTRLMDLNDAIVDAIALVQGQLDSHGTRLRLELSGELPQIPGDRIQLQQVLLNLIVNAMEAMDDVKDREPTIVVASGRADADHVFVEVRDCGPGLDPEDRARLFNPFYTTKPEGMGMGLSISRLIIEGHRGDLRALPNVPHGAVFRITLPRNEVEA
jgi:signal transduction histidine kinase